MSLTLIIFHFDISGNDFKYKHSLNKLLILITLDVSQLEISGKEDN